MPEHLQDLAAGVLVLHQASCSLPSISSPCGVLVGVVPPPPPSLVDLPSLSSTLFHPWLVSHPLLHSTHNPLYEQWLTGEGWVLRVVPRLRGLGLSVMWHEWRGQELHTMWVSHFLGSPSHPPVHN